MKSNYPPKTMVDDIIKSFGDAEIETYTYYDEYGNKGYGWRRKEK
jgi:hypothetical protein